MECIHGCSSQAELVGRRPSAVAAGAKVTLLGGSAWFEDGRGNLFSRWLCVQKKQGEYDLVVSEATMYTSYM